jgi:hypothetical protein
MNNGRKLSFLEFLSDIRLVITSPARRFDLIKERGAAWGSLVLLVVPLYFGFSYMGGVYFDRDPFPGYSFIPPLVIAAVAIFLKLFFIHVVARMFRPEESAGLGRGTLSNLFVVFGYTSVPGLLMLLLALIVFLVVPEEIGYLMRNFKALTFSVMVSLGIVFFIWNLILVILALRAVYRIHGFKVVIPYLVGSALMAVPAISTFWIVAPAHIDLQYVQPVVARKILRLLASDPTSTLSPNTRIEMHVDRLAYQLRSPKQFELVIFSPRGPQNQQDGRRDGIIFGSRSIISWNNEGCLVGRIVGLPGDAVEIAGGELRIGGQAWDEPYIAAEYRSDASLPATTLGPAEYLVLPENRRLITQMQDELVVPRGRILGRLPHNRWPLGWWGLNPAAFLEARPRPQRTL